MNERRWHLRILGMSVVLFGIISLVLAPAGSTYRWSFVFLSGIAVALYFARTTLALDPWRYGVLIGALLLHNLGAFGFYTKAFLGIEFDSYVHFFFGFAGGLAVFRFLNLRLNLLGVSLWVAAVLVIMGFGAIHELIEWASTLMLGPERGMIKHPHLDPFDTHRDLFNNLLGVLAGGALAAIGRRLRTRFRLAGTVAPTRGGAEATP